MNTSTYYRRVIPRDLFNEGSLLKCYGRLYIVLETAALPGVELQHDGAAFDVRQDMASGALYVANVVLKVGNAEYRLQRPLNSREQWPLYLIHGNDEETPVFTEDGSLTREATDFLAKALKAASK